MAEPVASTSIGPTQTVNEDTDDLYNELFSYGDNSANTEEANDDDLKVESEPCAPGTGPPVVRNVSEESVDIYSGILAPEFLTPKRRRKSHEIQSMYEQCLSAASALEIQNQQLLVEMTSVKEENDRLKKNISSLYQTAKAEVSRKDGEIYRLRKQVWNLQRHLNDVRQQVPPAGAPGYPQQATACMESRMNEEHLPGSNGSGFHGVVTNGDGEGSSSQVQPVGGIKTIPVHSSDKSLCLAENASPKKRTKLQRTLDKAKEIRSKYRERDRRQSTKESSRKTSEVLRRRSDSGKSLELGSTSRNMGGEHRSRDDQDSYTKQSSRTTSKKRSRSNDSCKSRDSKRSRSDYEHPSSSRKRRSRDRHRKEDDRRKSRSTRERRRDYSDEECDYSDCLDCERDRDRRRHRSGERRRDYDRNSHGRFRHDRKSVSPERKGSRRGRKQSPDRRGSKPKIPGKSTRIAGSLVKDSPMRSDSKSRYSTSPKKAEISWSERARSRDRNCDRSVDVPKTDNENRLSRSKSDAGVLNGAEKDILKTDKCADESFVEEKSGAPDEVEMEPKTQGDSKNTAIVQNSSKNEQKLVDGLVRLGQVSGTCKTVEQKGHSSDIYQPMSKPQAQVTKVIECKDSFVSGDKVKPDPKAISVLPERDNAPRDINSSVSERLKKCSKSSGAESKNVIKFVTKASLKEMPGEETAPQTVNSLKEKSSSKTGELVTEIPERKSSSSAHVKSSKLPVQLSDKVEQDFEQKDKQGLVAKGQGQGQSEDERKMKKKTNSGEKEPKKVSPKKNLFKDYCSKEKVAPVIETTLDKLFGEQDEIHLVDVADVIETSALPNCENAMELPGTDSPLKSKKTGYGSISQALRFSKEEEHGKNSTNSSTEPADALGKESDKSELDDKRSVGDQRPNPPVFVGEAGISCTGDEEAKISRMKELGSVNVDISGSIPPVVSIKIGQVDSNTFDTVGSNTFDTVSSMGVEAVATVGNTAYTVGNSTLDNLGSYSNTCDSVASNTVDTSQSNSDKTQCNIVDNSAFTALNISNVDKDHFGQSGYRSNLTVNGTVGTPQKHGHDSSDARSPLNNSVTSGLNRSRTTDVALSHNTSNSFSALDTSGCANVTNSSYSNANSSHGSLADTSGHNRLDTSQGRNLDISNVGDSTSSPRNHGECLSDDESDGQSGTSPMDSPEKRVRRRTCSVSFEVSDGGGSDSGEERSDSEAGGDGESGSGSGGEESEEDAAGLESEVEEVEGESDASVEEEEIGDDSGCEAEEQTESEAESRVGSQSGLEAASSGQEDSDEEDALVEEEESDLEIAESGDEEQEFGDEAGSMDEKLQVSGQSADESGMENSDAGQPQSDVNTDSEEEVCHREQAAESDQGIQESDGDEQYSEDESEQSDEEAESSEDEARPDQKVLESDERMQVSHEELVNKQDARGLQECASGNEQEVSRTQKSESEQVNLSQMAMEALEAEEKALVKEMQSLDQESQESRERQRLEARKARERSRVCETSAEPKVAGEEDEDIEEGELTSESEDEAPVMNDGADRNTARDSRVASERSQSKVLGTMRGDQPRRPVHERLGLLPSGTKKRARSPELERLTPPKRTRGEDRSRSRERPRAGISRHGSRHSTGHRSPRSDRGKSNEHIRSSRHDRKLSPHRVRARSPRHMSPVSERRKPAHVRGRSRDRIQSPRGRRSRTPELRSPHSGRSSSRDHSSRRHEHKRHEHSYERRERISSISKKREPDICDRRSSHVDRVKSGGSRVPGSGRPSSKMETKRPSRSHHHSRSPGMSRSRRRSPERRRSCSSRCSCSRSPSLSRQSPNRSRARRRATDRHSSRSCSRSRSPARHHHTPKTSGKRQDSQARRRSTDRRTSAHSRSRSRSPARLHHTKRTSATSGDRLKSRASNARSSVRSNSRRAEHHSSKEGTKSSSAAYITKRDPDKERSAKREPSRTKLKGRNAKDSATKSTTDISRRQKGVVKSGGDRKSVSRDESIDRIDDMDYEVTLESVGEVVDTLKIQNEENCTRVESVQRSHSTDQVVADKNDKCLVRNKISDTLENGQDKADEKVVKMKTIASDTLKVKKAKSQVSSTSIVRKSRSETSVVHKKVKTIESTHSDSAAKTDKGLTGDKETAASNDTLKSSAPVSKKKTIRVKKSSSCGNLKNKGVSGGDKMKGGKADKTKMKKRSSPQKVRSSKSQESPGEMSISEKVVSSGSKDCEAVASHSTGSCEVTAKAGSSETVSMSPKQTVKVKAKTTKLKKSGSGTVVRSPKVKQSSSSEKSKDSVKVKGSKTSEKVSSSSSKSDKRDPKAKTAVKSYDLTESSSTEKVVESSAIVSSSSENVRVKSKVKSRKSTSLEKVVKSAELKENQSLEKQSRNSAACKPKEGAATSDQILVDSTKPTCKGSNSTKASTPKSANAGAVQKSVKLKKSPTSGKVVLKSKSKESSTRSSSSQVEVQGHKTKPKKKSVEKVAGSGDKLC